MLFPLLFASVTAQVCEFLIKCLDHVINICSYTFATQTCVMCFCNSLWFPTASMFEGSEAGQQIYHTGLCSKVWEEDLDFVTTPHSPDFPSHQAKRSRCKQAEEFPLSWLYAIDWIQHQKPCGSLWLQPRHSQGIAAWLKYLFARQTPCTIQYDAQLSMT